MYNKIILVIGIFIIVTALIFTLSSCNEKNPPIEDTEIASTDEKIDPIVIELPTDASVTDFSLKLFNMCYSKEKNTLLSPISVLYALGMTQNGAAENTLTEMQSVIGMDKDKLNIYLKDYVSGLPQGDKYSFNIANSIWTKEDFSLNKSFLDMNKEFFSADVFSVPFDENTKITINNWVNEKTREMIPEVIDKIPENAVMYLINALAFEAEWAKPYSKSDVYKDNFYTLDGKQRSVEFMTSEESNYIDDKNVKGFIKYYKDKKYAFAAILPNEDINLDEYLTTLDGNKLNKLLTNTKNEQVDVKLPKFETTYDIEMSEVLKKMGIKDAFDPYNANFSEISLQALSSNLHINRVIHKTFISVGEQGTKAGAVTAVEMNTECVMIPPKNKVYLNRPFIYMLIDCERCVPFFIGTVLDINK